MRVFFFITKSEQGGAQTHVAQLTRWLVLHGHEVAVMSMPGGWLEGETARLGGQFFSNDELGNTASPLRLWRASRRFLEAVDEFKPDLVACHSTMAGLVGRLRLRGRIPTIFTAHGWGFTQGAPRLRRLLVPFLERTAGRFSKRIICVSQNDLKLARANRIAPVEKLVQIYNGIETSRSLDSAVGLARDDTDKSGMRTCVQIYFVGRLAPPKNPFLLIEAIARLPRELRDRVRVVIIGEGPDLKRLEEQIREQQLEDNITLLGALPREEVLKQLRTQADIFVLLSHWEGFPYSILEAMSAGIPVIASRVGGIPEALEHGGGILVDDLDQLVNALSRLIGEEHTRTSMGLQARHSVESNFSFESMCEKTFDVYRNAAKAAVK
ncbi:MAG: glycosyltransferase family 4 protein [Patescibacteria group bacterium]